MRLILPIMTCSWLDILFFYCNKNFIYLNLSLLDFTMFLYNLTLQRATGITQAVHGNFSGTKQQEVIVSRGKIIELLRPDPNTGKVYTILTVEIFGVIRALLPFRLTGGTKGNYFLILLILNSFIIIFLIFLNSRIIIIFTNFFSNKRTWLNHVRREGLDWLSLWMDLFLYCIVLQDVLHCL